MLGIRPKQLIQPEYHDYLDKYQDRVCMIHECAMYVDRYDITDIQIRTDAILLRQLQEEEKEQFLKQNNQIEYDIPPKYHIGRYQIKAEYQDE